jgi:uncharacterized membrane protein
MIQKLKIYVLALILFVAGIVHLIQPSVFLPAMPPYIPWHLEMIYFTGVVELVLALGIVLRKYRYWSSIILAIYFMAILPAHIHVAINGIPMFGIDNPYLLWGRTAFQAVFILWAFSLRLNR